MRNVKPVLLALAVTSAIFSGCASNAAPGDDGASASASDAITANDIMTRANQFIAARITYCGGPKGQLDETGCGGGICEPPTGPWDSYRQDCSGFVSYVWQIPSDPDTATYHYDQSGADGWTTIGIDSLRAGDAVVAHIIDASGHSDGHIKLFSKFVGTGAAEIYEEYDCGKLGRKAVQGFSRSGNHIWFDNDDRPYHAIRRNALTPPRPPPPPPHGKPTPIPPGVTGCGLIAAGHGLAPGKAVRSCDDRFELVMQGDGNLVEYGPLGSMWSTGTSGTDGYVAQMQGDGNFVLYGRYTDAKWNSGTAGDHGSVLQLQDDGNLVVRDGARAVWNARTEFASAPIEPTGCGALNPGHGLAAGKALRSCDGRFSLAMQTDGNLVLYKGGTSLWNSQTAGLRGYKVVMQGDGNLVMLDGNSQEIWNTHTAGHAGAKLDLQNDGNTVIYAGTHAVWDTHTSGH